MLGLRQIVDRLRPWWAGVRRTRTPKREITMLYTIAVILLIAWLLGIVGTYTIGAFVHVLLVVAIVLFVVGLLSGRRSLA
jgi:asparagine N-glycosylation enzyme membrane subunit Stt3